MFIAAIFWCASQGYDLWCQASHCLQHFVETPVTLLAYFFQKLPELLWHPLFGALTYHFSCFCTVRKKFHPFAIEAFTAHAKEGQHHFFDLMIEQINTTHLLVVILKRFRDWYINWFFGWLSPPFSCADSIAGNIVGGTSNNFGIQPRHYQLFMISRNIIGSSGFLR